MSRSWLWLVVAWTAETSSMNWLCSTRKALHPVPLGVAHIRQRGNCFLFFLPSTTLMREKQFGNIIVLAQFNKSKILQWFQLVMFLFFHNDRQWFGCQALWKSNVRQIFCWLRGRKVVHSIGIKREILVLHLLPQWQMLALKSSPPPGFSTRHQGLQEVREPVFSKNYPLGF